MQRKTWIKGGLAVLLLAGMSWLFLRSVKSTLAEPYVIDDASLSGWALALAETQQSSPALLTLQPPVELAPALFRQIFQRTMESMTSPGQPAMPVVLQSEFLIALREVLSPAEILQAARQSGLEEARFEPVCMAVKRESAVNRTRQLHFVVFEAPAVLGFRQALARLYVGRGGAGSFDPEGLVLVLPIASSDADFAGWWPLDVDRATDCQAPLD